MTDHEWLSDLRRYWPLLVGFIAMIALIVRVIDGQAQGVERYHVLKANQEQLSSSIDTLKDNQQFMGLVLCELLRSNRPQQALPKRCEDVFHGWGYP